MSGQAVYRVDTMFSVAKSPQFLVGLMHVQSKVLAISSSELLVSMNKHVSWDANLDTIEKAMSEGEKRNRLRRQAH